MTRGQLAVVAGLLVLATLLTVLTGISMDGDDWSPLRATISAPAKAHG